MTLSAHPLCSRLGEVRQLQNNIKFDKKQQTYDTGEACKSMLFVKTSQTVRKNGKTAVQGAENPGWMQVSSVETVKL